MGRSRTHSRISGALTAAMTIQSVLVVCALAWGTIAPRSFRNPVIAIALLVVAAGVLAWFVIASRSKRASEAPEGVPARKPTVAPRAEEHRGYFDDLTGLPARPWFERTLRSELARAQRYRHALSQIVIDIDGFSRFNADHGRASGDYVLMTISDLLRSTVRISDQVSRTADDEFIIVVPETDIEGAEIVGEKLRRSIELYPFDEGFEITVSVGIASATETDAPDSFSARAEAAVRTARSRGGNACHVSNA